VPSRVTFVVKPQQSASSSHAVAIAAIVVYDDAHELVDPVVSVLTMNPSIASQTHSQVNVDDALDTASSPVNFFPETDAVPSWNVELSVEVVDSPVAA
jgi:hypothetical protein